MYFVVGGGPLLERPAVPHNFELVALLPHAVSGGVLESQHEVLVEGIIIAHVDGAVVVCKGHAADHDQQQSKSDGCLH